MMYWCFSDKKGWYGLELIEELLVWHTLRRGSSQELVIYLGLRTGSFTIYSRFNCVDFNHCSFLVNESLAQRAELIV